MSRNVRRLPARKRRAAALAASPTRPEFRVPVTVRATAVALTAVALLYAFLAGFHTVFDPDLGWHMATGRYVVQTRSIPSTDVLSYTSPGTEWIYPPFAGVLFYAIHALAGYAGLTWFCALALLALVACLMRFPSRRESITAAALAIVAIPVLANRATPRPDLFSLLFFTIFLALLWRYHLGEAKLAARPRFLWLLPGIMVLWVNLHPGFVAGLGVVFVYLFLEGLEVAFPVRRQAALQRLRNARLPLAAIFAATLINPFGLKIYQSALALAGLHSSTQPASGILVTELDAIPISLPSIAIAFDWRNPAANLWWLAFLALAIAAIALWQRRFGAAVLIAVALAAGLMRERYKGIFAVVVVVLGSTVLAENFLRRAAEGREETEKSRLLTPLLATVAVAACLLACIRGFDLVSNRTYVLAASNMLFGAGESTWFPERASAFIRSERLPGNLFQAYDLGGYAAWSLGPAYPDFIDGRGVSPAVQGEYLDFIASPPDSPAWDAEVARRGINILFFSLARNPGLQSPGLDALCHSRLFRPVYMDEVSIVLLRDSPQNHPLLDRLQLDCSKVEFQPPTKVSPARLADFYANAGNLERTLGRDAEAEQAVLRSIALAPQDATAHLNLAEIYASQQRNDDAEREYKIAISLRRDQEIIWFRLARFYLQNHRLPEGRQAIWVTTQLTAHPARAYNWLGQIDLAMHQPQSALEDFDRAEKASTDMRGREQQNRDFFAQVAAGRAVAFVALKDWTHAIQYQQEATQRMPEDPGQWQSLADISQAAGDIRLAEQARQHVKALAAQPH